MIAQQVIHEIERMLAAGQQSQRMIARSTGVSRATVALVASGRRREPWVRPRDEEEPLEPTGPPERCPTCGGLVYMPCRLCHVRRIKANENDRRRARDERLRAEFRQRQPEWNVPRVQARSSRNPR